VFSFGDATFYGSVPGIRPAVTLSQPIVGMAVTPSGAGYYLVGADGGVFTFGDAHYSGSLPDQLPGTNIVRGIATDKTDGTGYWLVWTQKNSSNLWDVGILNYDAPAYTGFTNLSEAAVGIESPPASVGRGVWVVAGDGGIFTRGAAGFFGAGTS
jgi:hypothetical protein